MNWRHYRFWLRTRVWWWLRTKVSRKQFVSLLLLALMLVSFVWTFGTPNEWVGYVVFSLGSVVLSSDYGVVALVSEQVYGWIERPDHSFERIPVNYKAKQYFDEFVEDEEPERLPLTVVDATNFRANFDSRIDCIETGMQFWICVEAETNVDESRMSYPLRVGICRLSRVEEANGTGQTAFFTLEEWETEFEDSQERDLAADCRRRLARTDDGPIFAKIRTTEELEQFDLDEWETLNEWYQLVERDEDAS